MHNLSLSGLDALAVKIRSGSRRQYGGALGVSTQVSLFLQFLNDDHLHEIDISGLGPVAATCEA